MPRTTFIIIRVFIWLLPVAFLAWLAEKNFVISGTASFRYHQDAIGRVLSGFGNGEQYSLPSGNGSNARRQILTDGARFQIKPWRGFTEAELSVQFDRPSSRVTIAGVGQMGQGAVGKVLYVPEYAEYSDWTLVRNEELVLLQRQPKYATIDDFFKQPPDQSKVSVLGVSLGKAIIEKLDPGGTQRLSTPLQGTHSFFVYIEDEPLDVSIKKQDRNEKTGPDRLTASVLSEDGKVWYAQTVQDDGDETPSFQRQPEQTLPIAVAGLPTGVYRLELAASTEVLITELTTAHRQLFAVKKIRPYPSEETPARITAHGYRVSVFNKADTPATVIINNEPQPPLNAYKRKQFITNQFANTIVTTAPSLIITTDEGFVFDGFAYFDPDYGFPVVSRALADSLGIDYLLLDYQPPETVGPESLNGSVAFDLGQLLLTFEGYTFFFQIDDESALPLAIGDTTITLRKPPLTPAKALEKIRSRLNL